MKNLERILKALSNKRRLEILRALKHKKELSVSEIADEIKLSIKATSKHLAVLYNVDIVDKEQRSLQMFYKLSNNLHHIVKHISNSLE